MHLHKFKKPITLQTTVKMKSLFQASSRKKIHSIQEKPTKSLKKLVSIKKVNKIIPKNRSFLTIPPPLALLSTKNEHTIPIERKTLKHLFERSFITAHITNR